MNNILLKEKYNLEEDEFIEINKRCNDLIKLEERGLVISRCNCTNKSNRKYFKKVFAKNNKKVNNCLNFLEEYGGYCNCEILFNVVPTLTEINKEVGFENSDLNNL